MKKTFAIALATVLAAGALCAVGTSATRNLTYVAAKGTPQIDGQLDAVWSNVEWTNVDLPYSTDLTACDEHSARVKMMWDTENVYFYAEVTEPNTEDWNDTIEFYIDECNDHTSGYEGDDSQNGVWAAGLRDGYGTNNRSAMIDQCIVEILPNGFVCEIAVPYYVIEPQVGTYMGLEFMLNIEQADGTFVNALRWNVDTANGDAAPWSGTTDFGFLVLADETGKYEGFETSNVAADAVEPGFATADEAVASIEGTAIAGYTFVEGSNGNNNEGPENLWDGSVETKFCTGEFPTVSVAKLDGFYSVNGIVMATANDNAEYNDRLPYEWTISGSADGENWTVIASGDDSFFEEVNFRYFAATCDASDAISYVKFETEGALSGCFQISEVVLCGSATEAPVVEEAAPVEEVVEETVVEEAPVVEKVVETPVETAPVETVAPQTFDVAVIAAVAAVISGAGYAVAKKKNH